MRDDTLLLLPAFFIAYYQIKLWKKLPGNETAVIEGKYQIKHLVAFIIIKYLTYLLFLAQLIYNLFRITENHKVVLYIIGYVFITIGLYLSLNALKELKDNWDNMMLYKIKQGHKLIKTGVYKYIRHPIYCAIILEIVGYEIIANSWLFLFFLVTSTIFLSLHSKNEEELLLKHFGDDYINYKNVTKKFIPYVY